jgi:hypothetical protein
MYIMVSLLVTVTSRRMSSEKRGRGGRAGGGRDGGKEQTKGALGARGRR